MPNYDCRCDACGEVYEEFQGMNDPQPTKCIKCGGDARHIFITPVATYNNYSPCHPRKKRGTGIGRGKHDN